ncbi:acyltransferase [Pelagicoccus sp. SDUM812003]|uniref:acyltransferase family protein n=1 Tax=Pelagicoccus sp. SDUM812003 TaxID=3041267 RepID=UPI00280D2A6F|nr:acyltransferase [Pelagicoccus sp. SDUM812003]MDQ8204996.1 acyltransferase [Pelagicoccus sp. SDUM812003]
MSEKKLKKYEYIDALRGIAILAVFMIHVAQTATPSSSALIRITNFGHLGVQLFFLTSALTLFLSMASRKGNESHPITFFFIRRFFRIAPAFYLALIVYLIHNGTSASYFAPNGISWWHIASTVFFIHGWHPETITSVVPGGWSIAVEMTFYAIIPFLFKTIKSTHTAVAAFIGSVILSIIVHTILINHLLPFFPQNEQYLVKDFAYLMFFNQLPVFILGILIYHLIKSEALRKNSDTSLLFSSLSLLLLFMTYMGSPPPLKMPEHIYSSICFSLLIISLYAHPLPLIVNKLTVSIGKLSFSLYLSHFLVIDLLKTFVPDGFHLNKNIGFIAFFSAAFALSATISYISYRTIEANGIKLGRKIIARIQKKAAQ